MTLQSPAIRRGLLKLLEVKDSDIRLQTLLQGRTAVDRGVHIGGANSATIPLVALFYGGVIDVDVANPTRVGQDMFVLSKGHAVAAMAAIYSDLGYFDRSILENSRSEESVLNGHPGPLLPGVHVATGPLGQGIAVAQGLAMAGKASPRFNVFSMTGDGELQEGVAWEAIMYAAERRLHNLCMIVDKNEGQLDDHSQLLISMDNLPAQIESFGWRVISADGTDYGSVLGAFETFLTSPVAGKPTAIVCSTRKGYGALSSYFNSHKVSVPKDLGEQEAELQQARRAERVRDYLSYEAHLRDTGELEAIERLNALALRMHLTVDSDRRTVDAVLTGVKTRKAPRREKKVAYDANELPRLDPEESYAASEVVAAAMKVFARDRRVVSIDADLSSTSGLHTGVAWVDQRRAINIGIAEANMMCVGEAYASLGYNAWVSTFCPFFDWKVLRRTAVGYQERLEDIATPDGWLSEGHGLDLTYLATAPNFETQTNGATHMGNDDTVVFSGIAGLKIIDVSCPNQLLGVMRWIMEGNRGLVYLRIMRAPSRVIYPSVPDFSYGRAYVLAGGPECDVHLISSGRGVHEIIAAAAILEQEGVSTEVIDMASIDREVLLDRATGPGVTAIVEQNNGYIWNELAFALVDSGQAINRARVVPMNARREDGSYRFIHSATYAQLKTRFRLEPGDVAGRARAMLAQSQVRA